MASSSVMADSSVSASQYGRGTSSVNRHAPADARRPTSASPLHAPRADADDGERGAGSRGA